MTRLKRLLVGILFAYGAIFLSASAAVILDGERGYDCSLVFRSLCFCQVGKAGESLGLFSNLALITSNLFIEPSVELPRRN